jgi:formylglycine-generating enzyme required for sulfatase activity
LILTSLALPTARAVTIDWVTVGDPGNTADTTTYGAVADSFQIMKFEFTNQQYTDFLNAIDPSGTNPNSVYNASMGSDARGGISFNSLLASGFKYAIKTDMGNKPVNYVSWWDAARVSNWLHNGAQTYGSTDSSAGAPQNTGAYSVGAATTGDAVAVNSGARFYVPTENEWYKAAYYDPTLNSGAGGYRAYGNGFDAAPGTVSADAVGNGSVGGAGNFANYNTAADWNGQNGNVTTVGTNGGANYFAAYDMSGNIFEWNDLTGVAGPFRELRGGNWLNPSASFLSSSSRNPDEPPELEAGWVGFRLASRIPVPEIDPSNIGSVLAFVLGALGLLERRRLKAA